MSINLNEVARPVSSVAFTRLNELEKNRKVELTTKTYLDDASYGTSNLTKDQHITQYKSLH